MASVIALYIYYTCLFLFQFRTNKIIYLTITVYMTFWYLYSFECRVWIMHGTCSAHFTHACLNLLMTCICPLFLQAPFLEMVDAVPVQIQFIFCGVFIQLSVILLILAVLLFKLVNLCVSVCVCVVVCWVHVLITGFLMLICFSVSAALSRFCLQSKRYSCRKSWSMCTRWWKLKRCVCVLIV